MLWSSSAIRLLKWPSEALLAIEIYRLLCLVILDQAHRLNGAWNRSCHCLCWSCRKDNTFIINYIRPSIQSFLPSFNKACAVRRRRTCFQDALLQRANITFDGINAWDSSGIISQIYGIIATEKLGFNIHVETGPASELILGKLAGCAHQGFAITGIASTSLSLSKSNCLALHGE